MISAVWTALRICAYKHKVMRVVSLLALNIAAAPKTRARNLLEWLWVQPEDIWVLSDLGSGEGARLILDVCQAADYCIIRSEKVAIIDRTSTATALPTTSPRTTAAHIAGMRLLGVYGAASDPVRYSNSSQRRTKREWLSEFEPMLNEYDVVIGDLNIAPTKSLPYVLEEEVALYDRKPLRDAWGSAPDEPSWVDHTGVGVRYDQAWVSDRVTVRSCTLEHEPRLGGLTDHSALRVDLAIP